MTAAAVSASDATTLHAAAASLRPDHLFLSLRVYVWSCDVIWVSCRQKEGSQMQDADADADATEKGAWSGKGPKCGS